MQYLSVHVLKLSVRIFDCPSTDPVSVKSLITSRTSLLPLRRRLKQYNLSTEAKTVSTTIIACEQEYRVNFTGACAFD